MDHSLKAYLQRRTTAELESALQQELQRGDKANPLVLSEVVEELKRRDPGYVVTVPPYIPDDQ